MLWFIMNEMNLEAVRRNDTNKCRIHRTAQWNNTMEAFARNKHDRETISDNLQMVSSKLDQYEITSFEYANRNS